MSEEWIHRVNEIEIIKGEEIEVDNRTVHNIAIKIEVDNRTVHNIAIKIEGEDDKRVLKLLSEDEHTLD